MTRKKTPITIDANGAELEFIKFLNGLLPQKPDLEKISKVAVERAVMLLEFDVLGVCVEFEDGISALLFRKAGFPDVLVNAAKETLVKEKNIVFPRWKDKPFDVAVKRMAGEPIPSADKETAVASVLLHKIEGVPNGFVEIFSHKKKAYNEKQEFLLGVLAYWLVSYFGLARIYERLESLAVTDPLTGVYNRRKFEEELDREIERSRRYKIDFCLIMLDLDNLKGINDAFGHYTGDVVLQRIAKLLVTNLRKVDIVTRIGGDEFAVILPHTKAAGGKIVVERTLEVLRNDPVNVDGNLVPASVTLCITSFHPEDNFDIIYKRVDAGLNEAKRTSKGGYIVTEKAPR